MVPAPIDRSAAASCLVALATRLMVTTLVFVAGAASLGGAHMGGAIDAMKETDTTSVSNRAVAELRAQMRACLDEIDRLGLSTIAPHMDYAIARLDAAYPEARHADVMVETPAD